MISIPLPLFAAASSSPQNTNPSIHPDLLSPATRLLPPASRLFPPAARLFPPAVRLFRWVGSHPLPFVACSRRSLLALACFSPATRLSPPFACSGESILQCSASPSRFLRLSFHDWVLIPFHDCSPNNKDWVLIPFQCSPNNWVQDSSSIPNPPGFKSWFHSIPVFSPNRPLNSFNFSL